MRDGARLLEAAESRLNAPLLEAAKTSWRGGFVGGAGWMRSALAELRGTAPTGDARFGRIGALKYAICIAVASLPPAAAVLFSTPWPLLLVVPAFYAAEAQMIFLFPIALDGSPRPFRDARALVEPAGGTLRVVATVLPIAARMLVGGFVGRGFARSWCVGGLAVLVWYEDVRRLA